MNWQLTAQALGGLALFLLAMQMMTDGLKAFAGGALKRLLEQWTSTALRGVFSGILVTGLVKSERRNPKTEPGIGRTVEKMRCGWSLERALSAFGFQVSFGTRISNFGPVPGQPQPAVT